jgi:2-methylcitrate dehydratase PrpD
VTQVPPLHATTPPDGRELGLSYVEALWRSASHGVPDSLLRRTAAVVADTAAVAGLAAESPELAGLSAWASTGPSSTVLPGLATTAPEVAASINGTAAVWNELDEGFRGAGHPGAHVVPAGVAVAEAEGSTVPSLLLAILCGYQLQADLGRACVFHHEVHPHGALGAPAAALTAARLLGLDARSAYEAVAIAANLAPAGSWASCTEGSTVRNVLAGQGAQTGIRAAYLARAGVTAPADSLDVAFGVVRGRGGDGTSAVHLRPPTEWALARGYLKRWSACAWSHTSLDALDRILAERHVGFHDILSIRVGVPAVTMRLAGVHHDAPLAVRFSVPMLLSTLAVHGGLLPWADQVSRDDAVLALADRVEVVEDPALTARWPQQMPATVAVTLRDGTVLSDELDDPIGTDGDDAYVTAVREKLARLGTSPVLLDRLLAATGMTGSGVVQGIFTPGCIGNTGDNAQNRSPK